MKKAKQTTKKYIYYKDRKEQSNYKVIMKHLANDDSKSLSIIKCKCIKLLRLRSQGCEIEPELHSVGSLLEILSLCPLSCSSLSLFLPLSLSHTKNK